MSSTILNCSYSAVPTSCSGGVRCSAYFVQQWCSGGVCCSAYLVQQRCSGGVCCSAYFMQRLCSAYLVQQWCSGGVCCSCSKRQLQRCGGEGGRRVLQVLPVSFHQAQTQVPGSQAVGLPLTHSPVRRDSVRRCGDKYSV